MKVDSASSEMMTFLIDRLAGEIAVPFDVNLLWDPNVTIAATTGAAFVHEIFTGAYTSEMGFWTPDGSTAKHYRNRLGGLSRRDELAVNGAARSLCEWPKSAMPDIASRLRSSIRRSGFNFGSLRAFGTSKIYWPIAELPSLTRPSVAG